MCYKLHFKCCPSWTINAPILVVVFLGLHQMTCPNFTELRRKSDHLAMVMLACTRQLPPIKLQFIPVGTWKQIYVPLQQRQNCVCQRLWLCLEFTRVTWVTIISQIFANLANASSICMPPCSWWPADTDKCSRTMHSYALNFFLSSCLTKIAHQMCGKVWPDMLYSWLKLCSIVPVESLWGWRQIPRLQMKDHTRHWSLCTPVTTRRSAADMSWTTIPWWHHTSKMGSLWSMGQLWYLCPRASTSGRIQAERCWLDLPYSLTMQCEQMLIS